MANIAQTVNVLQAMVLTEGDQMLLTPTYHVFNMYKVHKGAAAIHLQMDHGTEPLHISASKNKEGEVHISLCHYGLKGNAEFELELRGWESQPRQASGTILQASSMNEHNTFEQPDTLAPTSLDGIKLTEGKVSVSIPPMSVSVIKLR